MKSPIEKVIEYLGISFTELCRKAQISPSQLHFAKKGVPSKVPGKLMRFFESRGIDIKDLEENYQAFRNA